MTQTQPTIYRSKPVDRAAVIADKDRMRDIVFNFACYMPNFTLAEAVKALGFPKDVIWSRVEELMRLRLLRRAGFTRDRSFVFELNTVEETCQ